VKKRYIFLVLSSILTCFVMLKKLIKIFEFKTDEDVFLMIKTKNEFMENFLIYIGIFLILISIVGITVILYNPYTNEKNRKSDLIKNDHLMESNTQFKGFEDLYS